MLKVSTLVPFSAQGYNYAYIFVVAKDYHGRSREEFMRQADAFAEDLGESGVLALAFSRSQFKVADQVFAKPWRKDVWRRMREDVDPIILVIRHDFEAFDPREHPWAIIWLSDLENEEDDVRTLLATLARKTRDEEDVIGYLRDLVAKTRVGGLGTVADYIELKPGIFGVTLNVSAILRDIRRKLAGR